MSRNGKEDSEIKGTILVVDDFPESITFLRSTLENKGYRVLVATTGEAAMKRLSKIVPDLILLDIILPGINGYETCKKIKADNGWKDIPIIFLSVLSNPHDRIVGFEAGAVDYLNKPCSPEELIARVNAHVNVFRLQNQIIQYTRELEDQVQDLESFTYMVSHDLRSPVRAVDGYVSLLSQKIATFGDFELVNYIGKIHENVVVMDHLIGDLLKLSRMSLAQMNRTTIDMTTLAKSVVAEVREFYSSIPYDISIDDLPDADGDVNLIRVVYFNLISNAVKFSSKQQNPKIKIGYTQNEHVQEYWIRDNGIGFDMEYAEKIFEEFYQISPSDEYKGTGIGLTIVKRIISRHNGEVRAISRKGEGSTFYFSIGE